MSTETVQSHPQNTTASARPLRKLLVVSYLYPPCGDVGVHRTLRFIKWLPHFGWEPIVLTAANAKVQGVDQSMLERVADVEVHRTRSFELLNYGNSIDGRKPLAMPKLLSRAVRELPRDLWRYFAVPDDKRGWVPHAVREGARLIRAHGIDAIYISGKPFSSYAIGERLGRRFDIPWIMDLRDLWTLNRRNRPRSRWRSWAERRLERRYVHSATAVIANTPDNRRDFLAAFPECDPNKFVAITNGYDRDDFTGLSETKYEKFTIAYSGAFYFPHRGKTSLYRRLLGLDHRKRELLETYSPNALFEALARLFTAQPELKDRIQVVMSGPGCRKIRGLPEKYGLENNVNPLGWLSYRDALEMVKRSHVSLLVLSRGNESRGWIPSKLFQYLGSGNPLIALVPDGDVKDIIRRTEAGIALEPDDVAGVEQAILTLYRQYEQATTTYQPNWEQIEQFEARQLTHQLGECLDGVAGGPAQARQGEASA